MGALDRIRTVGSPLMTGAEQEAIGINTFDIVTVTDNFAAEHPDLVAKFMEVTEAANNAYKADSASDLPTLAQAAGIDEDATANMLAGFGFPSAADQAGENWLGGGVQAMTKGVADVMVEAGNMEASLDDYRQLIDDSYLQ